MTPVRRFAWLAVALLGAGCGRGGFEQLPCGSCVLEDGDSTPGGDFDPTAILGAAYDGAKRFGAAGSDQAWSVAVDSAGNVLVAGSFSGTVNFGDGPRTSNGGTDGFVASFDASLVLHWVMPFGGSGDDEARSTVVDADGTATVVGTTASSVDLGCGPTGVRGSRDILLARLDAAGVCVQSRVFGAAGVNSSGAGVALAANGDITLAASIAAPTDFGGGAGIHYGLADAAVVRFDAAGGFVWARTVGSTTADFAAAVAVNGAGEAILTGSFTGPVSCAGKVISPGSTGRDVFLIGVDGGGNDLWCNGFSTTTSASASALATDTFGDIYLAGDFLGSVDLGGGALPNAGNTDGFVASYTREGAHRWSRSIGGAVSDHINGIVVEADVIVWLVGYFALTLDFGASHLVSNGSLQDIDVLAMDTDNQAVIGWSFGGTAYDFAYGVALSGSTCLEVCGRTDGDVDFGGGVLAGLGTADAFLLELCW